MPAPAAEPPDEEPAADQATDPTVTHAAALDDYLGGFAADSPLPAETDADLPGLLDTMLLLRQAAAADGVTPQATPTAMPRSIGRHAILRKAGEGGFATVWEGFDTVLRRPVAVKVRRPEMLLSEAARRRFVREAEIAARLVHPHLVTIFEVGDDDGREFIAAEFCSGGSLAEWLERHPGPLPPRDAARLVRALAGAVASAHAAGVIHRDIKPANVLLAPAPSGMEPLLHEQEQRDAEPTGLTVKLGDFGLGKLQEDSGAGEPLTQLTRTGMSIGTPAWMAPEQIDRSMGPVGPATDVHALGLLLDRLLTGRALHGGGTDAETFRQVLLDEVPSATTVVRGVPRDLAAVAAKCLGKDPRDRYSSADDLAADLDRWLDGRPTRARPVSLLGRGLRHVRRRPVMVGLAATALAASLAAGWAGVEQLRNARETARQEAEIRQQRAAAELRRGFETLRAGNVAGALAQLETTRGLDPTLAESLAGRWLVRRTHGEREILLALAAGSDTDRPRDLYAIALAPDGRTAAGAGADGTVRLVHGLDATPRVQTIPAHDEVNEVCFSADGSLLATAGQDGSLRWWHVTAAGLESAGTVLPNAGPLYAAAFTADGRSLVFGGEDRVVRLVRLDTAEQPVDLYEFEKPPGKTPEIESLVFVAADTLAASCGDVVVLLDAATGRLIRTCVKPTAGNRNAVFGSLTVSPDRRRLMACGTDSAAHVWDIATGRIVQSFAGHPAWVQGCAFAPDGTQVATACRDGGVRIFDVASGRLLERLLGHVGRVWSVAYEPSGLLLTAGADGTVRRWDPKGGFEAATTVTAVPGHEIMAVSPGLRPESVFLTDRTGHLQETAPGAGDIPGTADAWQERWGRAGLDTAPLWQAALDPRGRRLAVTFARRAFPRPPAIVPLEGPDGAAARPIPLQLPDGIDPNDAVICWTPAGDLVVRTADGGLWWCPADLTEVRRIGTIAGTVHALMAAPAGPPRVAAIGDVAVIHGLPLSFTDRATGTAPLVLPITGETTAVAWSPDAGVIACGTRTGAVHLCDATTGAARGVLAPHERMIEALAFAPDGRILFAADRDHVQVSDTATLTTFDELRTGIQVRGMCLTADAQRLVLGGQASAAESPAVAPPGGTALTGDTARIAVLELRAP
jgi:WD40 repeat protein/tRNA A-37 threonylcarbamoyl transferase component Bud32